MRGAIPPLPQYDFMAWCSVKSTGTILPFTAEETSAHTQCLRETDPAAPGDWQHDI
jgi:hypothetical protein